ncbi:hypothetical protein [Pseudanabaena mucicola]|uniref:PEP-CTERM sorting domain-containing protein n=1 Tax=Pseudanabaena mucicola FACHB-723 TaxID=2692860 RepID=A0ABR7ZUK5_9CYAN|nr:hypothetical protein [Pseudanabaena mucicola]MBD2187593.1 hypothetical protein [Pseudanabaena mucicola FACHB-723]
MVNWSCFRKSLLARKDLWFVLSSISLLLPSPSFAFTTTSSEGEIEFSVREVLPVNPSVRQYDGATTGTTLVDALLTPDRGYPLITEFNPESPVQKKNGSLVPSLSDTWTLNPPGKGDANITVKAIAQPALAGIAWQGKGKFLDDVVDDGNAVRNASYGKATFTADEFDSLFLYTELAALNVFGGIYLDRGKDAWVTGSIVGNFSGAATPHRLEILFGFDGLNRGREDFITAFLDGVEQVTNLGNFSGALAASKDTFSTSGILFSGDLFGLKPRDQVVIEGTFSCVAFNGYCGGSARVGRPVPVPSSVFGTLAFAALGTGMMLKRKLNQKRMAKLDISV